MIHALPDIETKLNQICYLLCQFLHHEKQIDVKTMLLYSQFVEATGLTEILYFLNLFLKMLLYIYFSSG